MTSTATTPTTSRGGMMANTRKLMRDYPVIPLLLILTTLIAALEILQPGIVVREDGLLGLNDRWISNTVKFAVPLAILAAAQTMTMITGGIDLSVGVVATMVAYVMATQVASGLDPVLAIPLALPVPPWRAWPAASAWPSSGCTP